MKIELTRVNLPTKFAVLFVVIIAILLSANVAWSSYSQRQQAQREMLETAQILALEMDAIWDFMEINQEKFIRDEDGNYDLYCVVAAKAVSKMFTRNSNYTIHYTNTSTRKDDDAPDDFELEALTALKENPNLKSYYALTETDSGATVFRYVEPLYIKESCLQCHGEPAGELDAMGYPKEGQRIGDIAGAASIIMPADTYMENVKTSIVQEVCIFALVVIGGLSVIFWCVSHLVTKPLKRIGLAAQQMEQQEFDKIDLEGIGDRDEIEDLANHLKSTAKQLCHLYIDLESEVEQRTIQLETANKLLDDQRAELEVANERLIADNRYKTDFLAIMSHELRTPLTSILAFSDIWKDGYVPRDEEERKIMHEVQANSQILLALVNNILDMARLEAGKMALDIESVELIDLVQAVKGATEALATKKGVSMAAHVNKDVPIITADGGKLRRILENLISNAIKFTSEGGMVDISVSYCEQSDQVAISVSDTGSGIKEEDMARIFDSFTQGSKPDNSPNNGSGLGLAVVKELVGLHGGQIEARSVLGEGSIFTVRIPVGDRSRRELS